MRQISTSTYRMSDTNDRTTGDTERDGYRLLEDTLLIASALNDAQYGANRYAVTGYDHRREESLERLKDIREMIDETLERYEDTAKQQSGGGRDA